VTRSKKVASVCVFFLGGSGFLALKALSNGDITLGVISAIFFCAVCVFAYWRGVFSS
jgi:hypothetical protein